MGMKFCVHIISSSFTPIYTQKRGSTFHKLNICTFNLDEICDWQLIPTSSLKALDSFQCFSQVFAPGFQRQRHVAAALAAGRHGFREAAAGCGDSGASRWPGQGRISGEDETWGADRTKFFAWDATLNF